MKKFIEIKDVNFVTLRTGRNFTSEIRMMKYIHNELSQKRLIRSLLAQSYPVDIAKNIAKRIKEADAKDLSGAKRKGRIKLYLTLLFD